MFETMRALRFDGDIVVNRVYTLGVLGDHGREIARILGGRPAAQPDHTILIGVDFDSGQGGQVFGRQFRFYLGCNR